MSNTNYKKVLVLGAGSWGTALASLAAQRSNTLLWSKNADTANEIKQYATNKKYLGNISLDSSLACTDNFDEAIDFLDQDAFIILGLPVKAMREVCQRLSLALAARQLDHIPIVWTCKGFEENNALLPHEIMADFPANLQTSGVLSGPSFAKEVAAGLPVALTVASAHETVINKAIEVLHTGLCRIYKSHDIVGVEVGGAVKNVIAVASGICDGLNLGANARAALITRGLAEMTRLGVALGADVQTFSGLTGLGDLILTATGDLSRNRQVGLAIGQGQSLDNILAGGLTAEGVRCARAVLQRAQQLNIEMPITKAVCDILFEQLSPKEALLGLLARQAQHDSFSHQVYAI